MEPVAIGHLMEFAGVSDKYTLHVYTLYIGTSTCILSRPLHTIIVTLSVEY